jgi:hypothetical protein
MVEDAIEIPEALGPDAGGQGLLPFRQGCR